MLPAASAAAAAANDAASADSSSTSGAAMQPIPAIDIAASNGSWLLPALSRSFVALDREFGAISEGSYVGSTAVVVLIGSQRLWVAHAGDSRAVLGRGGTVQVLTSDHKASRDDEVARVQVGMLRCCGFSDFCSCLPRYTPWQCGVPGNVACSLLVPWCPLSCSSVF